MSCTNYRILFTLILVSAIFQLWAQNTVGLIRYDQSLVYDGFNLIYPQNQPNVYLLNNCGEIVHTWTDDEDSRPGNTVYLREDGTLIKTKRNADVSSDIIWAGGGGETIEIRDWDNNLIWSFTLNNEKYRLHHDIAPLENGNILAVAWELKTDEEAAQAGKDTSLTVEDVLWSEYVFEIDPSTDQIVWEWHAWDHLIQDFDASKDNFGVVEDHPELIDINHFTNDGRPNFLHINAIDYHESREQVLLSVPYFNEVWIIDRSTTTAQAAGHVGGLARRGGDLIYRWGNDRVWTRDNSDPQYLFFQHDAHWIEDFVSPMNSNFDKIGVFNNQVGDDYSTVNIFAPPWDMYEHSYTPNSDLSYGPTQFDITLEHPDRTELYSSGLSSVQLLPNDNFLITSGRFGRTFEITQDQIVAWEYITPLKTGLPVDQGSVLEINNNLTFRVKRFPKDYSAFTNRDVSPKGWIETNPDEGFCDLLLPVLQFENDYKLTLYPNPSHEELIIEWEAGVNSDFEVFDPSGKLLKNWKSSGGKHYMEISNWSPGMYFLRINNGYTVPFQVIR